MVQPLSGPPVAEVFWKPLGLARRGSNPGYGSTRRKPPIHDGEEPDNPATVPELSPLQRIRSQTQRAKLPFGLGFARATKAPTPFPQGRHRGRGDTAGKKRPSPDCACPPWQEGQAGRRHGPCPGAGKPAIGGIPGVSPRRTGCAVQADAASERTPNTPHPSRDRHIAHTPGIASLDPIWQARRCQHGHGNGPAVPR